MLWYAIAGGIWTLFMVCFCLFVFQYFRYYHKAYNQGNKGYELAYREIDKIARQIVVGFMLFLMVTFAVCKTSYEEFLLSLQLGMIFNLCISPIYYHYFGDRDEFKFKKM